MSRITAPQPRRWWHFMVSKLCGRQSKSDRDGLADYIAPDSCPTVHLEGFRDIFVLQPGLPFYLDLLDRKRGFAFVKRTHGFWDGLVFLTDSVPVIGERVSLGENVTAEMVRVALRDPEVIRSIEQRCQIGVSGGANFVNHFSDDFYTELVEDLQTPLNLPSYIEANSFEGFPDSHKALNPALSLRRVYHSFNTSHRTAHDALVWKQAILDGTFQKVVESVRRLPVVLIGPSHLSPLGNIWGLRQFHHVEIPLIGAPGDRHSLLAQSRDALRMVSSDGRPPVVLYQAGALAFWLIYRLYPHYPSSFHLDVGRCLDVWFPEVVGTQPWFLENQTRIVANMRLEHLYGEHSLADRSRESLFQRSR